MNNFLFCDFSHVFPCLYILVYLCICSFICLIWKVLPRSQNLPKICYPPASVSQYLSSRPMTPYPVRAFRLYFIFFWDGPYNSHELEEEKKLIEYWRHEVTSFDHVWILSFPTISKTRKKKDGKFSFSWVELVGRMQNSQVECRTGDLMGNFGTFEMPNPRVCDSWREDTGEANHVSP